MLCCPEKLGHPLSQPLRHPGCIQLVQSSEQGYRPVATIRVGGCCCSFSHPETSAWAHVVGTAR
eukprot:2253721-Alexandrium_andersonii.AAC.1